MHPNFHVRFGTLQDLDHLVDVYDRSFTSRIANGTLSEDLRPDIHDLTSVRHILEHRIKRPGSDHHVLVLEQSHYLAPPAIKGFMLYHLEPEHYVFIDGFYTEPSSHRYGRRLLASLEQDMILNGLSIVRLSADDQAITAYSKMGFTCHDRQKMDNGRYGTDMTINLRNLAKSRKRIPY